MVLHEDCHFTSSIPQTRLSPAKIWEIKEISGFALSGGLLLLRLLLPQRLRQQLFEFPILKLPLGLDELGLVP